MIDDNDPKMELINRVITKKADRLHDEFIKIIDKMAADLSKDESFKDETASFKVTMIGSIIGSATIVTFANFITNVTNDPKVASAAFGCHAQLMKQMFDQVLDTMAKNTPSLETENSEGNTVH